MKLVILALLSQSLDAGLTCHVLKRSDTRELNPLLGDSCVRVVGVKSLFVAPLFFLEKNGKTRKLYAIGMISSGVIGVTFTLVLSNK